MYKKYSDGTLLSLPKKELLLHLRAAEHNRDVAEQTLKQQAKNMKDWMPVRHGHWIVTREWFGTWGKTSCTCSICGFKKDGEPHTRGDELGDKFCDECGAKMDLEVSQ